MNIAEKEIVQELKAAHTLINNGSSHPLIQKKLTDFGVAPKFFKEGQTLAELVYRICRVPPLDNQS